jgi:hypothetical protein
VTLRRRIWKPPSPDPRYALNSINSAEIAQGQAKKLFEIIGCNAEQRDRYFQSPPPFLRPCEARREKCKRVKQSYSRKIYGLSAPSSEWSVVPIPQTTRHLWTFINVYKVSDRNRESKRTLVIYSKRYNNSILYYLCAESTATRPITDTAQRRYKSSV